MDPITLTHPQAAAVRLVWDIFERDGRWPLALYVDTRLAQDYGYGLDRALDGLRDGVVFADLANDQGLVRLTVPAISALGERGPTLQAFVGTIRAAASEEATFLPSSPFALEYAHLAASDIATALPGLTGHQAVKLAPKLFELLRIERFPVEAQHGRESEWRLRIDRRLRHYATAATIEEYVALRPEAPAGGTLAGQLERDRVRLQRRPEPRGLAGDPYLFILMPFAEPWSNNVRDVIEQAARAVRASHPTLKWHRADDLTDTGRITDQIMRAIERSDVIVADVTRNNPNVMFELGYADALSKPIIVLNQDVTSAPFDIKDWRQIGYSLTKLADARDLLTTFLESTMRAVTARRDRE